MNGASNRSVGWVFAGVVMLVGVWPLWSNDAPRTWALAASGLFAALALFAPNLLGPLARIWARIGLLLHRVVNPIVLATLFYLVVTPYGHVMRLAGKRFVVRERPDATATSYWSSRAGKPFSPMDRQF